MNKKIIALLVTNGERDLTTSIKSIEKQGNYIDEIIIASEKKIQSKYKVFVNPYKNGLARNTMQGLTKIKMKYPKNTIFIATIDDDDIWKPQYIKKAIKKIDDGFNFISGYLEVFDGKKIIDIYQFDENLKYTDFLYGNPGVQGSNKIFDLDIALKCGGMPKHINSATDRAFNINLLLYPETKLGIIKNVVCRYDANNNRKKITNDPNKKNELKNFYNHFWHLIDKSKIQEINKRHFELHGIREVIKWK